MEEKAIAQRPLKTDSDPIHGSSSKSVVPVPVMGYCFKENSSKDKADKQGDLKSKGE